MNLSKCYLKWRKSILLQFNLKKLSKLCFCCFLVKLVLIYLIEAIYSLFRLPCSLGSVRILNTFIGPYWRKISICIYYFFSSKLINFYLVWNQFSFFIQTSVTINININEIFMKLVLILRLFMLQTGISFCVWQVLNL